MDKIKRYEEILIDLVKSYHYEPYPDEVVTRHIIIDRENHHYQVLDEGWVKEDDFLLSIVLYFQLKPDGKIWIMENWTEDNVENTLLEKGIPKSDIVLGLFPKYVRTRLDFAVS